MAVAVDYERVPTTTAAVNSPSALLPIVSQTAVKRASQCAWSVQRIFIAAFGSLIVTAVLLNNLRGALISSKPSTIGILKKPVSIRVHERDHLYGKTFAPAVKAGSRRILVTGAAGFIGSHTAMRLAARKGDKVIGLDNFNDYYDPRLKQYRAAAVRAAGAEIVVGDLCDKKLLLKLFKTRRFTHVVHLAAQAGVRFSLQNPGAYITANIMCTTVLLETIRLQKKMPVYIYASSSSVYGHSGIAPFAENQVTDQPASLYALTKQATESLAYTYHSLYGIRCTGLRFFTVYGPMGRPDMAVWLWTEAIMQGKTIKLFKQPTGKGMQRDFTYISDIVDGIVAAVNLGATFEVLNLGRGMPLPIEDTIRYISEDTKRKPIIKIEQMSAADVPATSCDITHAHEVLGYSPKVTLKEGVGEFVRWYKGYKSDNTTTYKSLRRFHGVKVYKRALEFPY
jgi:UDP-glucuronate 4-epimerase